MQRLDLAVLYAGKGTEAWLGSCGPSPLQGALVLGASKPPHAEGFGLTRNICSFDAGRGRTQCKQVFVILESWLHLQPVVDLPAQYRDLQPVQREAA